MIKFTKMQGLGNDYIYIYCTEVDNIKNISELAIFLSDRHFGIGGDGVILISQSQKADFRMRMFNSDGTEAQMCGNGIRCVGKFVFDKGLTNRKNITIETLAGIKLLTLNTESGKVKTVKVDMGEPILEPGKIPVICKEKMAQNIILKILDKEFNITCVSMGNPHAVIEVDNVESFEVSKYGPILEKSEIFPEKANIEFIQILDKETIKMRVWERGTGETLACGTGACASLVACNINNKVNNKATVKLLGGDLAVEWNKENNHIYMTGPAKTVYEGEFDYD